MRVGKMMLRLLRCDHAGFCLAYFGYSLLNKVKAQLVSSLAKWSLGFHTKKRYFKIIKFKWGEVWVKEFKARFRRYDSHLASPIIRGV